MRAVIAISASVFFAFSAAAYAAADYTAGLGLRLEAGADGNAGISYKQFLSARNAVEGLLLTDLNDGVEVSGLYMFQSRFPGSARDLRWYAGGGAHIGTWGKHDEFVLGPDGILGVEYSFSDIPLSISIDWHPVFNIITEKNDRFWPAKFGLTMRYTF